MQRDLEGYAIRAKLMTSPLQLGDWLTQTFGQDIVERRRARERAAAALEKGALVVLRPITGADVPTPLHGRSSDRPPASARVAEAKPVPSAPPAAPSAARIAMVAVLLVVMLAVAMMAFHVR
jgi:hypothetical protein